MPAGRPTDYKPEYCKQAAKLCHLGAIDVELANFFDVSVTTINNWKNQHPEFLESIKDAKAQADSRVMRSLFERATGYQHPEDKIFNNSGEPMVVKTTKHYPPDATSIIFWLCNRMSDEFRRTPEGAGGSDMSQALKEIAEKLPN